MSQPKRTSAAQDALRQRADGVARRLKEIDATLAARFPQYAALIGAGPVSIGDAASLLRPDEALLLFAPTNHATYLWAVTREASRWVKIPLGREKLSEHVAALRCGLDIAGAWSGAGARRCRELLKLAGRCRATPALRHSTSTRAHALYRALFGQVEDLIEGKHLLIVPAGALASFPFHVLVAEAPGGVAPAVSGPSPQEAADRGLARVEDPPS